MFNIPILYVIFNRLDYVRESMVVLQKLKPSKLYIAADGARDNRPDEADIVNAVREYVLNNIDWECDVKTLFQDNNIGCEKNVSGAVTWMFQNENEGIIIEDDCIPDMSFFQFCAETLDKYRDDKRVWNIGGWSPDNKGIKCRTDYFFGRRMHCWGWATWADRWNNNFKFDVSDLTPDDFKSVSDLPKFNKEINRVLRDLKQIPPANTWAWRWAMNIVSGGGLCIMPIKNMVCNIGTTGANYKDAMNDPDLGTAVFNIYKNGSLRHPDRVGANKKLEQKIYNDRRHIRIIDWKRLWRHLGFGKKKKKNMNEILVDAFYKKTSLMPNESLITMNQKITWTMMFNATPSKNTCADKFAVRDYVANKIGDKYLTPLLGHWDNADAINFSKLPNSFILKFNVGSGMNKIVKDCKSENLSKILSLCRDWFHSEYWENCFEMQYYNVPKVIMAEELLDLSGFEYNLWCFHGKVKFIQLLTPKYGNNSGGRKWLKPDWTPAGFATGLYELDDDFPKPKDLDKLIRMSEILASDFDFVRVDWYKLKSGKLKFGEMTFSPAAGMVGFNPANADADMGKLWNIPERDKNGFIKT